MLFWDGPSTLPVFMLAALPSVGVLLCGMVRILSSWDGFLLLRGFRPHFAGTNPRILGSHMSEVSVSAA